MINPDVIKEWTDGAAPAQQFLSSLTAPFRTMLVHAVRPDPFHSTLVSRLTIGRFHAVKQIRDHHAEFAVASDSRDICEAFAGLSIGAANAATDRIFVGGNGARKLITIGDGAFFASARLENTEIFLIGSEDVADLDSEVSDSWLSDSFSRFLPHAMALRHIFGDRCWHPAHNHASVIVDDPLLRPNYGFLNFERLLRMMEEHNFGTTIAFIPHNFRRNSKRVVRLFSEHADRLSLCFHGNDHGGAEFAVTDAALLHAMLHTAEQRMAAHGRMTGLPCERVMVFPQGRFSVEAMAALRMHTFDAAINTAAHPWQEPKQLTLRELAQPAVLRYAAFPLFTRRYSMQMQHAEIAFRIFFGIPLLLVEHHDIFENPQNLIDAVGRINRAAADIRWSSAGAAVRESILCRRDDRGILNVKAYAGTVRVANPSHLPERVLVEWSYPDHESHVESVYRDGLPCPVIKADEPGVRVSAVLDPGMSALFSIRYRRPDTSLVHPGFRYNTRAIVRRRLSEIRDNYISKSPSLLAAVKILQGHLH
ncbi:hypothetical protein H7849_06010 [Alloacidobacterium dinghuense]|uniref:Uncharacterized protein n=1 Tax=Alloacidobacterium dinghuense TaxID=2763107 RepID=A0A7G8BLT1_9BACT|nr:hypothetical protein [Alloacidobacterium dinghuense]QNI33501.1 hypothetical protein H7849_06010 [Alloacidobacterium dinghuense]